MQNSTTLAFRNIASQAATHVLIIPREHHEDTLALAADAPGLLADFIRAAGQVASQEGEGVDSLVQHTRSTPRDCSSWTARSDAPANGQADRAS